ncbi:sigma-70 family RNA polymerase sigma factor [Leptothoe sp. PORK10 BA2]|nr:sigma-70 family RNA polymerase sigma factor [Leptothoe sp. PORK10 BA2]
MFSTFATFADDRFKAWQSDPKLARSMQNQLKQSSQLIYSEKFWALYWYRQRHAHPYAVHHLWAYLQEPCYWASHGVTQSFNVVQCSLSDGFHSAIANIDRILNGYNPDHGSTLRAYAHKAFGNCIRDYLRQQNEINISSDWGILRRISQTQLTQAIQAAGFVQIESYILLWQCFKNVCVPDPNRSARGLPPPSTEQLEAIAKRYHHSHSLSPAGVSTPQDNRTMDSHNMGPQVVDTQQLSMELSNLAALARAYLTPSVTSLNQPQYDDQPGEEQLDALTSTSNPMSELVASEEYDQQQERLQQINQVLQAAIADLDRPSHTLLSLYYQDSLTQTQIAQQQNTQQYQVSRQLRRIRQQLLLKVVTWGQETLHISPESSILASVSEVIHEWLQHHYSPQPPEVSE